MGDQPPRVCEGCPGARRPEQKAAVLHCAPSANTSTTEKGGWWRRQSHGPWELGTTPPCRLEEPGSRQGLSGAGGSVLPGGPDSQSGVSSAALGSGLGPPSGGRGCPVAWRLRGVSMEVDHPAGREGEGQRAAHRFWAPAATQSVRGGAHGGPGNLGQPRGTCRWTLPTPALSFLLLPGHHPVTTGFGQNSAPASSSGAHEEGPGRHPQGAVSSPCAQATWGALGGTPRVL